MSAKGKSMLGKAVRQSATYGIATILSRATLVVSLLVLPLILTPRDYGALSMIVTVAALVAILVPLEVSQGLARFYAPAPEKEKKGYASSAWTFLLGMLLAFLVLAQLLAEPLCLLIFGDAGYVAVLRIALLLTVLNCIFYFLQAQCRWEFRTAEYVLISLVFSFLTLGLSIGLALAIDPPLMGVVIGQALGAVVAIGLGLFGLRRSFELAIAPEKLKQMLRFSLPLVPASVALFLSVHASRLILNGLASLEDVGVYTLAAQIAGIASLGIVGVQSALTPLIMAHHQEPGTPAQIARFFEAVVGIAIIACLALGLFAPEFIFYLGNPAYARAGPLVLILAPALLLSQLYVFAPGFAVAKRTDLQMWVSLASAAVAVVGNFWLISLWGTLGAALATLASGALFLLLWFMLSQRLYPIPVRWIPVALACAAAVLIGVAAYLVPLETAAVALGVKAGLLVLATVLVVAVGLVPFAAGVAAVRDLVRGSKRG